MKLGPDQSVQMPMKTVASLIALVAIGTWAFFGIQEKLNQHSTQLKQRSKMNKLYLVLALLFALSACSVGKKCTYTQDGTKISSWVWFFQGDKPIDLDKNNCN